MVIGAPAITHSFVVTPICKFTVYERLAFLGLSRPTDKIGRTSTMKSRYEQTDSSSYGVIANNHRCELSPKYGIAIFVQNNYHGTTDHRTTQCVFATQHTMFTNTTIQIQKKLIRKKHGSRFAPGVVDIPPPELPIPEIHVMDTILTWIGFDQQTTRDRIREEGFGTYTDLMSTKAKDIRTTNP